MADPNTRTGKRTPVTLKIKFKSETLEQFIERYAVDVSQGGIFIRTKEPLAVGTQMRFEFQLRDASPLIGGEGTVVWTRENDPSRPAIAPGMGVRFDRLAEGSQSVLERILAEKAKQTPQRPASESTKPPLFTDTPTRVAPAPIQEQLLGVGAARRRAEDSYNDQHTPLPKPMPFHSDADEFPDEAFEEATKVRALDELVAQTALDPNASPEAVAAAEAGDLVRRGGDPAQGARGALTEDAAPGLPSPPEPGAAKSGRLLDTTPSPRTEVPPLGEPAAPPPARTKLGLEAPRMAAPAAVSAPLGTPGSGPIAGPGAGMGPGPTTGSPTLPGPRAVAAESTSPVRASMPVKKGSGAAIGILVLVLVAAAAAGVWFFFLRDKAVQQSQVATGSGSAGSGSAADAVGSGSAPAAAGSAGSVGSSGSGSAAAAMASAGSGGAGAETPKAPAVDTVIDSSVPKSTVEIVGTDQKGTSPFTAKLEKGKPYKARVVAPGFLALELDVVGGAPKHNAALVPKPRVLAIKTEPEGAVISVDNVTSGKLTPKDIELTPAQAAKRSVRVRLFKNGYKLLEKSVPATAFVEEDARMVAKLDERLAVAPIPIKPPPTGGGAGSGAGSAAAGAGSGAGGGASGGDTAGSAAAPPPPPPPPAGPEPEPDVSKTP